jgi:HlyD family secretion protein
LKRRDEHQLEWGFAKRDAMTIDDRPTGDLRTLARGADSLPRRSVMPSPKFAWKSRILVPGVILTVLLLLIGYSTQDALWPARAVRVIPVVVKAGMTGATSSPAMGATVQAPGWVEADPYTISVSALADGVVKEVLALEGTTVKQGDVLARLIDDDAKLALAKAEAELADQEARLQAAQRTWDNPIERTRAVATTEAMVAEAQADLVKLDAEIAAEAARLVVMKFEADRLTETLKTRASSEFEAVRAQQLFSAQTAVVDATKARRRATEAQLVQRNAELTAAKENLRLRIEEAMSLAGAKAKFAVARAARDEAALRLSRMEVRSPASGIVMQRMAAPGSKLVMNMDDAHSSHVVLLYDPQKLQVRVDIPLADAAKVGVGQEAQIVVGVLPDRTFAGKVTRVVNEADIQKNTLQVKVAITDPSSELKPEMLARVRFSAGQTAGSGSGANHANHSGGAQTVFAPLNLIHRTGDTAMAWVVDPRKNTAVHRTIQLGSAQQDGWVAVTAGLLPGDQLIADNEGLNDGQRIRVAGEASLTEDKKGAEHAAH